MFSALPLKADVHRVLAPLRSAKYQRVSRRFAARHRLTHLKPLELRVIQIQRLVVPCPTMRCPERLRLGPRFKRGPVFPDRVRSIKCVVLSLGTFEKVKL